MIDIHSHVIPNLDDGCKTYERALDMVKEMVDFGVTDLICTPHYRGHFISTTEETEQAFNELKNKVTSEGIEINLYLGREIYMSDQTEGLLFNNQLQTINNTQFVLAEYDFKRECDIAESVYRMTLHNLKPIVAHYERYHYATTEIAEEIRKLGGYIQINATSIFEKGFSGKKLVRKLLKEDLVDFIASDLHDGRKNYMMQAYKFVKRKYGLARAKALFIENAEEVIKG